MNKENDFPKIGALALRALYNAGYTNLAQFSRVKEAELASLHGMEPKALRILRTALPEKGLTFKQ